MRNVFYKLRYFLIITLFFLILGTFFCVINNKVDLHLYINQFHYPILDKFFKNITWIGDGAFALLLIPYLIFFTEFRTFLLSLFTCVLAGLMAQFFKKLIFVDAYRPKKVIGEAYLYTIDGVDLHTSHAFPSGHTTSAFALFILLAFFFRKNIFSQIIFGLSAVLVGFSRVYLSQHFLEDIVFGGFLGILSFCLAFLFMKNLHFTQLNKPLFDLIFAKNPRMLSFKKTMLWKKLD